MTNLNWQTGKTRSIPKAIGMSAFVSILITFIISVLIAIAINKETIAWTQAGYCIMGMLFLASFIGAKCAYTAIKCQQLMISVMSAVSYWGILLCFTALFFGGNFSTVWETAAIIFAGCCCSILIKWPIAKNNPLNKHKTTVKLNKKHR